MQTCLVLAVLVCGQVPSGKVPDDAYVPRVGDRAVLLAEDEKGRALATVWVARSPAAMEDFLAMDEAGKGRELRERVRVAQARVGTEVAVEEIVLIRDRTARGRLLVALCKVREPKGRPWYVMAFNVGRYRE